MLALIQRVTSASVTVDDAVVGAIGPGLLALVAVEPGDAEPQFRRMAERLRARSKATPRRCWRAWRSACSATGCSTTATAR